MKRIVEKLGLQRLADIAQLPTITPFAIERSECEGRDRLYGRENPSLLAPPSHSRLDHSRVVARHMARLARALNLSREECHLAIVLGLVHDVETPPLGDCMKNALAHLKLRRQDEDARFARWNRAQTNALFALGREIGLPSDAGIQLAAAMQKTSRTLFAQMLNLADTLGYLMLDAEAFLVWAVQAGMEEDDAFSEIQAILLERPTELLDTVTRIEEDVVVTDSDGLRTLLEWRVHHWNHFYQNPTRKAMEYLFGAVIAPALFLPQGNTPPLVGNLRSTWKATDPWAHTVIDQVMEATGILSRLNAWTGTVPLVYGYQKPDKAFAAVQTALRDRRAAFVVDKLFQPRTGTKADTYLLSTGRRQAAPYSHCYPRHAAHLERSLHTANQSWPRWLVYDYGLTSLPAVSGTSARILAEAAERFGRTTLSLF